MPGISRLTTCPYCGKQLHLRGLASHIAFKHPRTQIPLPIEEPNPTPYRIERLPTELEDRATPSREATTTTRAPDGAVIRPKTEFAELATRSETAEKRQGGGWLLAALIVLALWLSRKTSEDAIETLQERQGTHLGRGIGGYYKR